MLRIGSLTLETPLLLAPIAGYCDLAFRLVVRSVRGPYGGVGLACTDLLCPQALLSENDKSLWLAATSPDDKPVCMQLYGRDPDIMADAALWAQAHGATTIDVNMGCPVDKVTKKNGGSRLLCEPMLAVGIVQRLVRTVRVPVTCKIRLGWDEASLITDTLPVALADAGAAAITVHGRTAAQKFRGSANLEGITRVVQAVKRRHPQVSVIGNGDVTSPPLARRMFDVTGCDGVMIGRGALGQPWIFRDTAWHLATGQLPPPLPRLQRAQLVLDHFNHMARLRDDRYAVNTIRTRMSWYSQHLQPWPHLKRDVQPMKSAQEFRDYFQAGMERIAQEDGAESPKSQGRNRDEVPMAQ